MKKIKKLIVLLLCISLLAAVMVFTACNDDDNEGGNNNGGNSQNGGNNNGNNNGEGDGNGNIITPTGTTTVFEFEDLDYSDKSSSGLSGAAEGWELVGGISNMDRNRVAEDARPSNNYYAGFTYEEGFTYEFEIHAQADVTVEMILRMNSEVGVLELGPNQGLAIIVNDVALDYDSVTVYPCSYIDNTFALCAFADYQIKGDEIKLKEGDNTIVFMILEYQVSRGQAAPLMDCMKLSTSEDVTLTFSNNYQVETGRGYHSD